MFCNLIRRVASYGGNADCPQGWNKKSKYDQQVAVMNDNSIRHCYCDQFNYYRQHDEPLCTEYLTAQFNADLIIFAATLVIVFINLALDSVIRRFAKFEKHHSVDSEQGSIFWRLFILKFLNLGCSFLFANSFSYNSSYAPRYNVNNVFNTKWFDQVAVSIVLVQFGDTLGFHFFKVCHMKNKYAF